MENSLIERLVDAIIAAGKEKELVEIVAKRTENAPQSGAKGGKEATCGRI